MKKEYHFSKLKRLKNPYTGKKKAAGIHLSPEVVDYFKGLAEDSAGLREKGQEAAHEMGSVRLLHAVQTEPSGK